MKTEEAVLLIVEMLDVLVGCHIQQCGVNCEECEYYSYNPCEQITKIQSMNAELKSSLAKEGDGDPI